MYDYFYSLLLSSAVCLFGIVYFRCYCGLFSGLCWCCFSLLVFWICFCVTLMFDYLWCLGDCWYYRLVALVWVWLFGDRFVVSCICLIIVLWILFDVMVCVIVYLCSVLHIRCLGVCLLGVCLFCVVFVFCFAAVLFYVVYLFYCLIGGL